MSQSDVTGEAQDDGTIEVAPDLAYLRLAIVNAVFFGVPGARDWVLIDAGIIGMANIIRRAAAERFGADVPPAAIVLTHGHFDHVGALDELAREWDVPVYAHPLEAPYLDGSASYPPPDPTVGGGLTALLSPLFPRGPVDVRDRLRPLPEDGPKDGNVPPMPGWRWLHTPGHSVGHVSLWRESDRTLIAGDAVVTTDLDSWTALATMPRLFDRPPAPLTPDWDAALASVQTLAALAPEAVGAGHGRAITRGTANALHTFAQHALPPAEGRYAHAPALADEHGLLSLPPSVPDPFPLKVAAGALAGLALLALRRR